MKYLTLVLLFFVTAAFAADNPIDQRKNQMVASKKMAYPITDDYTFIRRLWLDATGTLPTPTIVNEFINDQSTNRRDKAIDRALASDAFNHRWTAFLEEMFNNQSLFAPEFKLRNEFHKYLRESVENDTPWDQTARGILTWSGRLTGDRSAFVFWQSQILDVEYRLDQLDDQVAYITSSFLGIQTRCISCHDGKYHLEGINEDLVSRKRADFWGMAAFLSSSAWFYPETEDEEEEESENEEDFFSYIHVVDTDAPGFDPESGYVFGSDGEEGEEGAFNNGEYVATSKGGDGMRPARAGGTIQPVYMFTGETPRAGETRREALARMITADRQFARNMVNRIWAHYFGEGFVNPVNGFDLARLNTTTAAAINASPQPYDSELLESMTDLFIKEGFKFKPLMRSILQSELYQLDYEDLPQPGTAQIWPYWGGNRRVRRLQAEGIVDALFHAANIPGHMVVTGLLDEGIKTSTWQMPGSTEPSGYAIYDIFTEERVADPTDFGFEDDDDFMARQYAVGDMLQLFGRGHRIDLIPRDDRTNIQTALGTMNNPVINWVVLGGFDREDNYIDTLARAHARGQKTTDQVIDELYLRALVRPPSDDERSAAKSYIGNNSERVFDLLWALVNLPEFIYR